MNTLEIAVIAYFLLIGGGLLGLMGAVGLAFLLGWWEARNDEKG